MLEWTLGTQILRKNSLSTWKLFSSKCSKVYPQSKTPELFYKGNEAAGYTSQLFKRKILLCYYTMKFLRRKNIFGGYRIYAGVKTQFETNVLYSSISKNLKESNYFNIGSLYIVMLTMSESLELFFRTLRKKLILLGISKASIFDKQIHLVFQILSQR